MVIIELLISQMMESTSVLIAEATRYNKWKTVETLNSEPPGGGDVTACWRRDMVWSDR
jgi:pyridoxal/pyridoxine/pyridoxamine kinase